jgi:hypothetical protein
MLILSGVTIAEIFEPDDRTIEPRRWKREQVPFQHRRHVAADKFAPGSVTRTCALRIAWRNASPKYLQVAHLRAASLGYSYSSMQRSPCSLPGALRETIQVFLAAAVVSNAAETGRRIAVSGRRSQSFSGDRRSGTAEAVAGHITGSMNSAAD